MSLEPSGKTETHRLKPKLRERADAELASWVRAEGPIHSRWRRQATGAGLAVRRALDADPATGQRRWTDRTFVYPHCAEAEFGYAVTDHVAQSRTVTAGLAVVAGTEDRRHAYVALSRGTDTNMAYVFTVSPKLASLVCPGKSLPAHSSR
jgi:hypothetical protein